MASDWFTRIYRSILAEQTSSEIEIWRANCRLQPRSQGLPSLSPLVVGCTWSCDRLWHKLFHRGRVSQSFLSISTEAKERSSLTTPLKFSSPVVSFTQVRRNVFIEVSLWFQFQPVCLSELKLFNYLNVSWINLTTVQCSLAK